MAETFKDLLENVMTRNLLTQEQAAERTGVPLRSLKRYLAGGKPQSYNAAQIADAFGLDRRRVAEAIVNSEGGGGDGNHPSDHRDGKAAE